MKEYICKIEVICSPYTKINIEFLYTAESIEEAAFGCGWQFERLSLGRADKFLIWEIKEQ